MDANANRSRNLAASGGHFQRVTRIVKVQNLVAIAPLTFSPTPLIVTWPNHGVVLWILAAPAAGSTADDWYGGLSSLGLRINVQGQSEFVTNGQSADFVQFGSIMPSAGFRFPVNVEVYQNDSWQVYIRNTNATDTFTPDVAFGLAEA